MNKPLTPYNNRAIIKNIENVYKTMDIERLTQASYTFLHLLSGFIAHYDINGFKYYYQDLRLLTKDILESDQPYYLQDAYFIESLGQEYCASHDNILIAIKEIARENKAHVEKVEASLQRDSDIEKAKNLLAKHGIQI